MDNHDKIFDQFKKASENAEAKPFASMDKVWLRVEEKLDKKVLKKENKLWKKIAIAASLLLLVTLGYQIFKPETQKITIQKNEVAAEDSVKMPNIQPQNSVADVSKPNPVIKKDAGGILQKQISNASDIVANEKITAVSEMPLPMAASETDDLAKENKTVISESPKSKGFMKRNAVDAKNIERSKDEAPEAEMREMQTATKSAPMLVVEDNPVASASQAVKDGLSKLDPEDVENIMVLNEPLYIINGHDYTEPELFGPNPTSPYAPLNQQEIETLSILQGEKAVQDYGKRGEKGVVIITTKNNKPVTHGRAGQVESKASKKPK